MEDSFLTLLISGHYSDWFLNVFMTNITLAIKNNLAVLLVFAFYFHKYSVMTKNKYDDKISAWIDKKLGRTNLISAKKEIESEKIEF